ncbi:hypothetical protein GSI_00302 [Ganoderma sinense ZZ0214-1]|uniref:NmrA-like domain-containing protein n=1 Tax=Ganoderma sinense ZZ0214-1 TaxID=1077348 RepID=A0A2G8SSC8_9APHY|nr:hypothetical protein GSI_00302 [Ganoderma sinense ZZ0214-1]
MPTATSNVKATVAILGGTGNLGYYISKIFLTEYRWAFPTVRLTTRDASSAKAQELIELGAELHPFDGSLDTSLAGVDVVVNTLSSSPTPEFKTGLLHAVVRHGVKVYFPSEFGGYDVTQNLFPGYEHPEWVKKGDLAIETHAIMDGKVKVVRLDNGGFLTWMVGPGRMFNWDAETNVVVLALDPATAATVPAKIRVAGNIHDFEEIREIVSRVQGIPKDEIICKDLTAAKEALKKKPSSTVFDYVKLFSGEGAMDFTDNDNELVNPGQSLWKWKTVEEEFRGL